MADVVQMNSISEAAWLFICFVLACWGAFFFAMAVGERDEMASRMLGWLLIGISMLFSLIGVFIGIRLLGLVMEKIWLY